DWQEGFNGNIEIINRSEECIEDWQMEVDFDNRIDTIWNAEIIEHTGNHYIIGNKEYNQNIQPAASIHIGFTCKTGDCQKVPKNYQIVCSDTEVAEVEEETEEPEVGVDNATDYVYIDFQAGNTYDSVIEDVTFVNDAEDRMQVTWESSDESVVTREGKVFRQDQNRKVIITAHILIDGQELVKEFALVVMEKINIDTANMKDYSVDELKTWNQGDEDYYCEINDFGYLQTLYGKYSTVKVDSYEAALYSLYHIRSALGITNPFTELQVYDIYTSEDGYTFHFRQVYEGVAVFSNEVTVYADENGNTSYIRSSYYPFPEQVDIHPKHSYDYIRAQFQNSHPMCEIHDEEEQLCLINYYGHVDLVWSLSAYFPVDEEEIAQGENQFLLGATDGEMKYHVNLTQSEMNAKDLRVSGTDLEGNRRRFAVQKKVRKKLFGKKIKYYLQSNKRRIEIHNGESTFVPTNEMLKKINDYHIYETDKKDSWSQECVSAMANMEKIYDYFFSTYRRYSYNCAKSKRKGKQIKLYIHTGFGDNLRWDNLQKIMVIGEGTGKSNKRWRRKRDNQIKYKDGKRVDDAYHFKAVPLAVADDLMCHEFAHAVFFNKNMPRYPISKGFYVSYGVYGILNEAYADILACCYDENWTMGEKAAQDPKWPVRDITNPSRTKCATKISEGDSFYIDYTDFSNDGGGMHANSTIISHIFFQLKEKSELSWGALEKVWMYSVKQIGYDLDADFWDVALNLRKSLRKRKLVDEIKELDKLLAKAGITEEICNKHYSNYMKAKDQQCYCSAYFCDEVSLQGKVVSADQTMNLSVQKALDQVTLRVMDDDNKELSYMNTSRDGMYEGKAAIREKYCVRLQRKGYLDEIMYVADINEVLQTEYYCDTVNLIPEKFGGTGGASGKIADATDAKGVGGIRLVVRKGINNIYTEPIQEIATDAQGNYHIQDLEAGNYCLEILSSPASSYINTYFNIVILGGCNIGEQNGVVSPMMGESQMRVVLTWGETPRDLDAHMWCTVSGDEGHVYYKSKTYSSKNKLLCQLDVDDTSSYGPETITLRDDITGTYRYYVYNYSDEDEFGGCGAVVRVYLGGTAHPAYTFHVPSGQGRYWNVFTYHSSTGRIQVMNEMAEKAL
ncbi:MAG: cellulose binding domain-containing protein, partial [Eubacteriales bacterium]|nr:cellulose binding domain-containing protein [Eubacteriales bacterium]